MLILISIGLGLCLSFVFIGPLFFLTIETGLTRGRREGISLILGAVLADFLFVMAAYSYSDLTTRILNEYPLIKILGGIAIVIYGIAMKQNHKKIAIDPNIKNNKYFQLFSKGFAINIINVGIFFFWLFIVHWIGQEFPGKTNLKWFVFITLFSYASFETAKLFFARHIKNKLTDQNLRYLHKTIRLAIIIFGVFIIFK